jgi:hypothetical protein
MTEEISTDNQLFDPVPWMDACLPGEARTVTIGQMTMTIDRRPLAITQKVGDGGNPVINLHGVDLSRAVTKE